MRIIQYLVIIFLCLGSICHSSGTNRDLYAQNTYKTVDDSAIFQNYALRYPEFICLKIGIDKTNCVRNCRINTIDTSSVTNDWYFKKTFGHLLSRDMVIWEVSTNILHKPPGFIIAVFDENNSASDILLYFKPDTIIPLVKGEYYSKLKKIKVGMDVSSVFDLVGSPRGFYEKNKSGEWMLLLFYRGMGKEEIQLQVDVHTGIITAVKKGYLL